MGRHKQGEGRALQYPSTYETAVAFFGLRGSGEGTETEGLGKYTDRTGKIHSILRALVYYQVSEMQKETPELKQEDLLFHDFVTSITEILTILGYKCTNKKEDRLSIWKEFTVLRAATMYIPEKSGELDKGVDGFYSRFAYADEEENIVIFNLSLRGIKSWCSQLTGNKFTVRYTNASKLTDGEAHLYEYFAIVLQVDPELLKNPELEHPLAVEFIKKILLAQSDSRQSKDFSYVNRTVIASAIEHIAQYTNISFKYRRKKGERRTKTLCFYDFHRDDNVKVINHKPVVDVNIVYEQNVDEEPKVKNAEVVDSYFAAAADVLGFSTAESFELSQMLNGDREKLKAAHESYQSLLKVGMAPPDELEFIRNVTKK